MAQATMTMRDDFEDPDLLRQYLASQLRFGRLALVLGAGISMPFGLPNWRTLVTRLFAPFKEEPPASRTAEAQVDHLKRTRFKHDPPGFVRAVHAALYQDVNVSFHAIRSNPTLSAVASLVMATRRGTATQVITFNFDNLLETFLIYHGFVVQCVFRERHWNQAADVSIYHPHGMIPYDLSDEHSAPDDIILDQKSISAIIGDDSKPWRQLILTALRRHTCLFIGLSGNDNNLDTMLVKAQAAHVSLDNNTAYWGVTFAASEDAVFRSQWADRGVYCHRVLDYTADLPEFLFGICQEAAKQAAHHS